MKSIVRKTLIAGAVLTAFSLTGSQVLAQNPAKQGWSAGSEHNPHIGPPAPLSQRPKYDGDIHKFRQDIREWIENLREWIKVNWRHN